MVEDRYYVYTDENDTKGIIIYKGSEEREVPEFMIDIKHKVSRSLGVHIKKIASIKRKHILTNSVYMGGKNDAYVFRTSHGKYGIYFYYSSKTDNDKYSEVRIRNAMDETRIQMGDRITSFVPIEGSVVEL